tara:strand:+ start:1564 stop:1872 length:309 start_codon:yes stop_codon:yes gene_type:complete
MEKEIDWYGALVMSGLHIGACNVALFVIAYALYGEHWGLEVHILASTLWAISGTIRGVLIPYKGFLEKEEDNDDDYYQAPKQVQYAWDAVIVLLIIYVFFIL